MNGGYTVEQWPDGWGHLWRTHLLPNLTANIITPTQGQPFYQGSKIPWFAHYESVVAGQLLYGWNEQKDIKTDPLPRGLVIGNNILRSGYGTNQTVEVVIKGPQIPTQLICYSELDDRILPATSGQISKEMHLPLWIDTGSGVYKQRLNGQVQFNKQDDIYTHPTSFADFFENLTTPAQTINNINNPWIDPKTGKYWTMSISFGAFDQAVKEKEHERYYINMQWVYGQSKRWWLGKKIWIKNPTTRKAVVTGILDWGPVSGEGVAGASPEALKAIGASHDSIVEFCWAEQEVAYGSIIEY